MSGEGLLQEEHSARVEVLRLLRGKSSEEMAQSNTSPSWASEVSFKSQGE